MTMQGEHRIAIASGAVLADTVVFAPIEGAPGTVFEPRFWAARNELTEVSGGRGAAWFVAGTGRWVLRHYRRGGYFARVGADRYVWTGEARVRSFAEWRLLAELRRRGLPVPRPVAARYQRAGVWYRCDLLMERIIDARPLSAVLLHAPLSGGTWSEIGATIARLHAAGADHADLNAHNILLDSTGAVSVVDFDRGRIRPPGRWTAANLARLHRSLLKVTGSLPKDRFSAASWGLLLKGYAS